MFVIIARSRILHLYLEQAPQSRWGYPHTVIARYGVPWRSCPTPVILTLNEVKGKNLGGEENDVMRLTHFAGNDIKANVLVIDI